MRHRGLSLQRTAYLLALKHHHPIRIGQRFPNHTLLIIGHPNFNSSGWLSIIEGCHGNE